MIAKIRVAISTLLVACSLALPSMAHAEKIKLKRLKDREPGIRLQELYIASPTSTNRLGFFVDHDGNGSPEFVALQGTQSGTRLRVFSVDRQEVLFDFPTAGGMPIALGLLNTDDDGNKEYLVATGRGVTGGLIVHNSEVAEPSSESLQFDVTFRRLSVSGQPTVATSDYIEAIAINGYGGTGAVRGATRRMAPPLAKHPTGGAVTHLSLVNHVGEAIWDRSYAADSSVVRVREILKGNDNEPSTIVLTDATAREMVGVSASTGETTWQVRIVGPINASKRPYVTLFDGDKPVRLQTNGTDLAIC